MLSPGAPRPRATAGAATGLALVLATTAIAPSAADAEPGRYTRRRAERGDVTDTAPKIDAWAFFDDSKPSPLGMTLLVDTWAARHAVEGNLMPLRVGLGYEGQGSTLPLRPWTFELSWDGGSTRGLAHEELREVRGWQSRLSRHRRLLTGRPRPYDSNVATIVSVAFYPSLGTSTWRSEGARLSPGTAFTDLVYFRLPEELDAWRTRFVLTHVPSASAPPGVTAPSLPASIPAGATASAAFRIERDPELHQRAFRHARRVKE